MPTDTDAPDTEVPDRPVLLLDTSTAIALVIEDHARHRAVLAVTRGRRLGLAGHAWFETYSVLTRLPAGLRRSPADTLRILRHNFPASSFLSAEAAASLCTELVRLNTSGGSVYDALVGAAARQHQQPLLSADARARPIYDALDVELEIVEDA
jgi:predicted nucleic acid-binding protein